METFRQSGESLAGRYFAYRLHPISVREWCEQQGGTPEDALTHLFARGGFPEVCLADDPVQADRWRAQYITDLVREDVLEFSRVQELGTMKLFVELLRERVGSPLSLASIARDLAVSPATLRRYLDILQAPKVYFYGIGLVRATTACASRTRWPACCSSMCSSSPTPAARPPGCTTCAPRTAQKSTLRLPATVNSCN